MKTKKYDEASVVRILSKNPDIEIKRDKTVEVLINSTNVGNGSWGKIDYLCKVHGYVLIRINPTERMLAKQAAMAEKKADKAAKRAERNKTRLNLVGKVKDNIHKPRFK